MSMTHCGVNGLSSVLAVFLTGSLIFPGMLAQSKYFQDPEPAQSQARGQRIGALISIVKNRELMKSDPVQIETAIRELGSLRATEALDVLVPMLDYVAYEHRRSDSWFRTGQGDRYPAVTAVAQIGQPAVPALLKAVVDGDPDSVFASNARWTLVFIFKNDLDEGIRVIEAAAKDSQSARASARLRLAADHLRNTQRELSRPRS